MAITTESGHVRNVTNLERLVAAATMMGTDYNPSKSSISLPALKSLLASSTESLDSLQKAVSIHDIVVDVRKVAFSSLNSTVTRIYNSLKSSDSSTESDLSVAIVVRKLRGQRVSERLTAEELEALKAEGISKRQTSSSQMSFDTRLDNFKKLVYLLSNIPEYKPNEPGLKVEGLMTYYQDLSAKNTAVIDAWAQMNRARNHRYDMLYRPLTGLVDLAQDAKMYICSVAGTDSIPYKQIAKLSFRTKKR